MFELLVNCQAVTGIIRRLASALFSRERKSEACIAFGGSLLVIRERSI